MKTRNLITALLLTGGTLLAQPDTIALEDITVSVTPFEQRLSEATGSLSILKLDAPTQQQTINIADQLNNIPGVFIGSGTYTTNRVTIRGVGSRTPYSSNRIRAYLAEMPLTNGDGISTIEDMDISGLARAEVLKGPASAIYGSGLGGVILLKPLYPDQPGISYRLSGSYGSFSTSRYNGLIGYKNSSMSLIAGYTHASSNGFRENNEYRRDQLFLHTRATYNAHTLNLHLTGTLLEAQIPSSLNETDFLDSPEKAAGNWLAINGFEKYQKLSISESWRYDFSERFHNNLTLFSSYNNPYESRPFNILDDQSVTTGLREYLEYRFSNMRIRAGTELFLENYNWKIFSTNGGTQGEMQLHNEEKRRYLNLFAHAGFNPTKRLNLEAGFNVNILQYALNTLYHIENDDQSGSYSYDPIFSPRIGANYSLTKNHFIHTSAGHGFSAPSLEETLLPEGLINPDLLPETGWNIDIGIRGKLLDDHWQYDIAVYTIFISNMLVTERAAEDIFTGINAGETRLSGLEMFNEIEFGHPNASIQPTLTSAIFFSNNEFTRFVDDGNDFGGNALPGIPAQIINTTLNINIKNMVYFSAEMRYSGRQFMNDANALEYEGHLVGNSSIAWQVPINTLPFGIEITADVNNVFNTNYASMILVNAPSGGTAPRYYYPGMPRNIMIGLRVRN